MILSVQEAKFRNRAGYNLSMTGFRKNYITFRIIASSKKSPTTTVVGDFFTPLTSSETLFFRVEMLDLQLPPFRSPRRRILRRSIPRYWLGAWHEPWSGYGVSP